MLREEVIQIIEAARSAGEVPNFHKARLNNTDLSGVDLNGVNLSQAQLVSANLSGATLVGADLSHADMHFANLRGANLSKANLNNADIRFAELENAIFKGALLEKVKGITPEQAVALSVAFGEEKTKDSIRAYEAKIRSGVSIVTNRTTSPIYPSPILPSRWEALKREAIRQDIPLKPLIKPVPEAIRRIEKELRRIEDTGMGRLYVISGVTGAGKTTFLNSLDLFIEERVDIYNLKLKKIDNQETVDIALLALNRKTDRFSIVILEGKENPGTLKGDEQDILLAALNADFRSDFGFKTLFVIPTTSAPIGERIGERATNIGGMTSPSSLHYVFEGPSKNEFFSITDATFRALNNSRTLYDYGLTEEIAQAIAQSSKSIGSFNEGCYEEIQATRDEVQSVSAGIKRKRIHLWMVFCSYEDDARINYNTIRSLTVGELQQVQIKRLIVGDSKQVRYWENKQTAFAQAALYLDLRVMYLPIRTTSAVITAYGYEELVDHLKKSNLVDREATRARAQESLSSTALGMFLRGKGFADPDLTKRRLTEQQQAVFKEASRLFSQDEKTFNALLAEAIRDWFKEPESKVVTELPLNDNATLISDIAVVTPTDVYCLEIKWRADILHESEVIRQTAGRVREFAEELPELRKLIDQKLPMG